MVRRAILIPTLMLALALASTSSAEAAFYLGGGKGIRVAFRVQGQKLVWANVFVRLYCVRPDGERHFNRYKENFAEPEYPLGISPRGGFHWDTRGERQEQGFTQEEFLWGRVSRDSVKGRFEFFRSFSLRRRTVKCRTGSFPLQRGQTEVPFTARRRVGQTKSLPHA
jgi:hypothetical protein